MQLNILPANAAVVLTVNTAMKLLLVGGRFRSSQSEIWQTVRVVPGDSCCLTVYDLRPHTRYQFMLLARDQHGDAYFSRLVNAMTTRLSTDAGRITADQQTRFSFLGLSVVYLFIVSFKCKLHRVIYTVSYVYVISVCNVKMFKL